MRYHGSWLSCSGLMGLLATLGLLVFVSLLSAGTSSAPGQKDVFGTTSSRSERLAAAQAAQLTANPKLAEIIKKAAREKKIIFQISEPRGKLSTAQAQRKLAGLVRSKFGVNLNVKFTYSRSFPAASARALMEINSGSFPTYDLMYQTTGTGIGLYRENALEPVPWRNLFDWISKKDISYGGRAIVVSTTFVLPAYNTDLVKADQVPKSWEDLLNPKWKGKLGTTIYQDMWPNMARPGVWGEKKTKEFITKLSMQNPVLGRFPEVQAKVVSGEIAISVVNNTYGVNQARAKGAPIAYANVEPVIVFVRVVFVPKKAQRPNAAILVAATLLTPEGQVILDDGWAASSLFRPGTPAAKFVKGKKLALPDVDFEKGRGLILQKVYEKILVRR